ncbi:hypothetical protein D3C83_77140 [compost metagenome]
MLALMRQRAAAEARVTEEEIRMLVAEAESIGLLTPEERSMIAGVMPALSQLAGWSSGLR